MSCSSNQIAGNCFTQGGNCNKECSPSEVADVSACSDTSGPGAGMYGYTKACPTTRLAHPRSNEGFPRGTIQSNRVYIGIGTVMTVIIILFLLWYRKRY